ncbi:cytochrome P450 4d2-like isoform X2 [Haematobia irritans]|uniref:cytochrome P450 4d2-like isoform X2 n=1 Tax=Haematobia irritans TaxID=7368 RepID=UPI003F5006A8
MFVELTLTLVAIIIVLDFFNKKQRNDLLAQSNIIGPKPWPIIDMDDYLKANTLEYGKIYRFWVFHQMHLRVADPKFVEAILSSQQHITKSSFYDFLVDWLGRGLLMSNGKKWHSRRKIITPAFHFKILEQFVDIFDQQSAIMVNKLQTKADGKTVVNMFPVVCGMALVSLAEAAMGVKVNAQENPDFEYVKALNYVSMVMSKRFVNPSQRTPLLFRLTSPKVYKETQRCIDVMHKFTTEVIEKRRDALEAALKDGTYQTTPSADDQDYGCKLRMAFLDVLLQSTINGEPLSNEDIREEVDTFMFEGHDTTTSAISFALYLIARHPEVQTRLIEEITEIVGKDRNKAVSFRDLQDMKYLECVIKETLRLYPSVPAVGREILEDVVLGGIKIPSQTNIILSFSVIMRDPEYFPDPDAFKPERFFNDGEPGASISPFLFTPFSAGPRNCIGQRFAMLEMKSAISKMLRYYELLPLGPEVRRLTNIVMRSKNGANIGLLPRFL